MLWRNINNAHTKSSPNSVITVPPQVHEMAFEASYFCRYHIAVRENWRIAKVTLWVLVGRTLVVLISSLKRHVASARSSSRVKGPLELLNQTSWEGFAQ